MISKKMKWVATSGWHGHHEPVNGVCGANDTGTWSDSPCPSTLREREIKMATSLLRKNDIKYVTIWGRTSNVFCNTQYVVVESQNIERAKELVRPLRLETSLLFTL